LKKLFLLPLLIFLVLIFACEDKTPAVETNTYTVFFYHNNELIKVGEYTEGETVIFPEIMNNPGFVFKGFFLNDKLLNENFLMPNTDIVINKIFIPIVYTITFNIETVPSQYINHGELIEIPIEPTKEKYIFLYWSFNGYEFDFNTPVTNDIMLIAVFEPIIYTISFNIDSVPNQYLTYLDNIIMPDNPVKEHHVFLYWTFNGYEFDFNTPVTSDIVLIAVFKPVIYIISFETNGGYLINCLELPFGSIIYYLNDAVKDGYVFLGWFLNRLLTSPVALPIIVSENLVLYAKLKLFIPPTIITIMHPNPCEIDPFHPDFNGHNRDVRRQQWRLTEQYFNVAIKIVPYPSHAHWGHNRVHYIIDNFNNNTPLADMFGISNSWIPDLAIEKAIVPVSDWINDIGSNINDVWWELGSFKNDLFGFENHLLTVSSGLFFNYNLLTQFGIENPTQIFLDGNWTWSRFEEWALNAKKLLPSNKFVLGGAIHLWADQFVHLNGGNLINPHNQRVEFHLPPALEAYDFIINLKNNELWDATALGNETSFNMISGNILLHPGHLAHFNSPDSWGNLNFQLEFVPFPINNTFFSNHNQWRAPENNTHLMVIANGTGNEKLAFQVWNMLQVWLTDYEQNNIIQKNLSNIFLDNRSIEAITQINNQVVLSMIYHISNFFSHNSWFVSIHNSIRHNNVFERMHFILSAYEAALKSLFNIN